MKKITKKMIKESKENFDGTCPFNEYHSSECSKMSYEECNKCEESFMFRDNIDTIFDKIDDWCFKYVPGVIYRIPYRIKNFYYYSIHLRQRLFRLNHTSNRDLWNLYNHLGDIILPKLKAFIDIKHVSYPAIYSEYDEHSGYESKEQYDEYIKSGDIVGGGLEAWKTDLNEMLFAFEYIKYSELFDKRAKAFYKRWNLEDPHEEKEENRIQSPLSSDRNFYYNTKLAIEYDKRVEKGFELFGKRFQNLWD